MPLKLHASQYIDPRTGEISPKDWEATMDPDEVKWCWLQIHDRAKMIDEENGEKIYGECLDGFRAARMWKSSQRRLLVSQLEVGLGGMMEDEPETRDAETEDA